MPSFHLQVEGTSGPLSRLSREHRAYRCGLQTSLPAPRASSLQSQPPSSLPQMVGIDPVIKQIIVFINKDIKTVIITLFYTFKKIEGKCESRMGG